VNRKPKKNKKQRKEKQPETTTGTRRTPRLVCAFYDYVVLIFTISGLWASI